ncbi:MAG: type II CRISPR-associated endonuclease Cas1 [Burkholderiales bacterium]|nr:type II CRISPR-associated endonuclease Cas1 [Burkholderiales bacterium]
MVWRSVVVSNPAKLRRDHFSLIVEQVECARVPFEDIAVIVLNHREITLTHPVLSACGEYGISLFSTGDNHQPNGVFTAFLPHTRATRILRLQLAVSRPTAKRAWAEMVRAKIANQARCLRLADMNGFERLASLQRRVRSGDPEGMEALAAAHYFPNLFGPGFDRHQASWTNASLNYGYAVLRGAITRGIVAHGMLPSIGLFHASEQNAFNLADDLIEPFRPIVDLHVATEAQTISTEAMNLTSRDKIGLVGLLNVDVRMPTGEMTVLSAIEFATESLKRVLEGEAPDTLQLPTLIGLRHHPIERT